MPFGSMTPGTVEADDDHVWVDPPRVWSRRGGRVALAVSLTCLVVVVWALVRGERGSGLTSWAIQVLLWGGFALQGLGRWGTLVDARGVHRPFRRVLPWSRVRAVPAPARFDQGVRLRLADGRAIGIAVPVEHAALVARIGGVPLEGEPPGQPATRPAPGPGAAGDRGDAPRP